MSGRSTKDIIAESDFLLEAFKQSRMKGNELIIDKYKCPMSNQGICEKGIVPMCKFNDKKCFVNPLVYSLFLREKRELV